MEGLLRARIFDLLQIPDMLLHVQSIPAKLRAH